MLFINAIYNSDLKKPCCMVKYFKIDNSFYHFIQIPFIYNN